MDSVTPRQYLPIIRQISDPLDSNTYYVRAYIYKCFGSKAPELVATVDLVDRTGQRFTYEYQTPADVSGEGYVLSIITKVFTDSGYTTESSNYAREADKYSVIERVQHFGGGADIDYKRLKKIIKEEIEKLPKAKTPLPTSLEPLLNALEKVNMNIEGIRIPEPERIDFKPVRKEIQNVADLVKKIHIPETNLLPIIDSIQKLGKKQDNSTKALNDYIERIKNAFKKVIIKLGSRIGKIESKMESAPVVTLFKKEEVKEKPKKRGIRI